VGSTHAPPKAQCRRTSNMGTRVVPRIAATIFTRGAFTAAVSWSMGAGGPAPRAQRTRLLPKVISEVLQLKDAKA